MRLRTRFIILFTVIMTISLLLFIMWSNYIKQKLAETEMHEKAYVLSKQLDAVWEFMSIHQDRINYDANGLYNFKGLHCSLVGKSIGKLFGLHTGYVTRYVNHNPRNPEDMADGFETAALKRFEENPSLQSVYALTEYKGEPVFRYVVPKYMDQSCLECHGKPAGELDIVGFPKEGWEVGDLGGALSIIMPAGIYMNNTKANVRQEVAFFTTLLLVLILIIYYATAKLVTKPLDKLTHATEEIRIGKLNTDVDASKIDARGEIKDLTIHFDAMIKELRAVYNDLENKVELRTRDLANANKTLEFQQAQLEHINSRLMEDNQYKSDFLAIMSHELRTPLTSIIAFTEVLEKVTTNKPEKEQRVIQEIKANGTILLTLINTTLEMARVEAGKSELLIEPVDMVDVVQAVSGVIKPLADKKNIDFTGYVERNVPIVGVDREKIRRIVENLASNAIKFTLEDGKVELRVKYEEQSNELHIKVKDNGIGIGKGHLNLIFDKFIQGDSSIHRPYSGSGLGLALAREYAEMHGGRISVVSELGKGSLFTVIIPAGPKEHIYDEDNVGG